MEDNETRRQGDKERGRQGVSPSPTLPFSPSSLNLPWLNVKGSGIVQVGRIVAVGHAEAATMKRLIGATPLDRIVVLTGGQKRRSVMVLDSGHLVITPLTVAEVERALAAG